MRATSLVAPVITQERRKRARVKVSLELRIRPADFNDGSFEEIRSTLNASRDSFYFFTPYDRYHKAMRLFVAPASASSNDAFEKASEVVRVHRRGSGFCVAVVFSKPATVSSHVQFDRQSVEKERRFTQRQLFVATTELIDVRTGGHSWERIVDLSTGGCYIDTLNPFPLNTIVRLRIQRQSATVELCAKVTWCHPGSGMGLLFEGVTSTQRATLSRWLCKEPILPESSFVVPSLTKLTQEQLEDQPRFARLLEILERKGVLSKSEVLSLLRGI
jgi:PilZ domain